MTSSASASDFLRAGRYDLAEKLARRALAENPDDARAHVVLGACRHRSARSEDALTHIEDALRLAPDLAFGHSIRAEILLDRGRAVEGEAAAREALRHAPNHAAFYGQVGAALLLRHRYSDAIHAAEAGLAIDPNDEICHRIRAQALSFHGRTGDSRAAIQRALAVDPGASRLHEQLALASWLRGDLETARLEALEVLRINPESKGGVLVLRSASDVLAVAGSHHYWWLPFSLSMLGGRLRQIWLLVGLVLTSASWPGAWLLTGWFVAIHVTWLVRSRVHSLASSVLVTRLVAVACLTTSAAVADRTAGPIGLIAFGCVGAFATCLGGALRTTSITRDLALAGAALSILSATVLVSPGGVPVAASAAAGLVTLAALLMPIMRFAGRRALRT